MKILTPAFVALTKAISGFGGEAEQGKFDSRQDVSNIFLPSGEFPAPLQDPRRFKSFEIAGLTVTRDSFMFGRGALNQVGVNAGSNILGPSLGPGLWHIQGFAFAAFVGTLNAAGGMSLILNGSEGFSSYTLFSLPYFPNANYGSAIDFRVAIGYVPTIAAAFAPQIQLATSATIAGDSLSYGASVSVMRIL